MFIAKSLSYFPNESICSKDPMELNDEIIVPSYYLNNIMKNMDDNQMLCMNMINIANNQNYIVAIGAPHTYDKNTIYAPQWILDLIGCTSDDDIIKLETVNMNDIPVLSKIIIKPLDHIAFEIDTTSCFEKALMNIHTIKEGITISVKSSELGIEYDIFAYVEKVEPASICRISNGEVDVEFINEFEVPSPEVIPIPEVSPEVAPEVIPEETLSVEERRRRVRESWAVRTF